jgi:hypothetical protein
MSWSVCEPVATFLRARITYQCDPELSRKEGCEEELKRSDDLFPEQFVNMGNQLIEQRRRLFNATGCSDEEPVCLASCHGGRACIQSVNRKASQVAH